MSLIAILSAVGGVIAAIVAAWIGGKSKGAAVEKVKAAEQRTLDNDAMTAEVLIKNQNAIAEQNKATVEANEIDEAVSRMSDIDVLNELRNGRRPAADVDNGDKK